MNIFFLASLFLFLPFFSTVQAQQPRLYNRVIYVDNIKEEQFEAALRDLQAYLKEVTGQYFTVRKEAASASEGIFLFLDKPNLLPPSFAERLRNGSAEDFVLSGNDKKLLIVATHPTGLSHGIYTYLDQLGVKWYLPGREWEFHISKSDITYQKTAYVSPSFSLRDFFGTGDIRFMENLDPGQTVKKEWRDWKRRNRIGGEMYLGGHYGEQFNLNYKKELLAHPEYLALKNGQRIAWRSTASFCYSNQALRKLIISDRVNELLAALPKRKSATEKMVLSVDPADGGDHCECTECKKLGSVSNRVFLLANEVADAFAKISPKAFVNLYAYQAHAAPPGFLLRPNVIVQIVPYAFHKEGTPEQLIEKWKKHHKNIFIYDYYALPDWHHEVPMPRKTSVDTLANRILYWKKEGIKGFLLESTYGTGMAGIALYIMARLGWDPTTDVTATKKEFYRNLFEASAESMQQYFEHISSTYRGSVDLPLLYSLLEISRKRFPAAASRYVQLEAYLHYLTLYAEWAEAGNQKPQASGRLMKFIWQIYGMKIIHSTRVAEILVDRLKANDPQLLLWNLGSPLGTELQKIQFITPEEVTSLISDDRKKYPMLKDFPYLKRMSSYTVVPGIMKGMENTLVLKEFPQTFIQAEADGRYSFSVRLKEDSARPHFSAAAVIICIDPVSAHVTRIEKKLTYDWQQIVLKLPPNKQYQLEIEYPNWIEIRFPTDQWTAFSNIVTYGVMGDLWFYVPPATGFLYFSNATQEFPRFYSKRGEELLPVKVNAQNLYRIPVKDKSGGWYRISQSQYKVVQLYLNQGYLFLHANYLPHY